MDTSQKIANLREDILNFQLQDRPRNTVEEIANMKLSEIKARITKLESQDFRYVINDESRKTHLILAQKGLPPTE